MEEEGRRRQKGKKKLRCGMFMCQLHTRNVNVTYCNDVLVNVERNRSKGKLPEIGTPVEHHFSKTVQKRVAEIS